MKTKILGVNFDVIAPSEAVEKAMRFINSDSNKSHSIYTPNPEIVMAAHRDKSFEEVLNNGSMVIPDGIGIVYASKLNKIKLDYRVPGYDLVLGILEKISKTNKTVYFLGSGKGIAELAKKKLTKQFVGLKVIGTHDGYFDEKEEKLIIDDITETKPDILLVGLGFPRQEKWIDRHLHLPVKLMIGVGGSLDGFAGVVTRAPVFYQKHGLEWLYRLIKQPSRIKRQLVLPLFAIVVVKEKIKALFNGKK